MTRRTRWMQPKTAASTATPGAANTVNTVLPLILLATLVATDVLLGVANISGTFILAPFLASALTSLAWTAGVGAFATVAAVALSVYDGVDSGAGVARILTVATGALLAAWVAARWERRERQLADLTRVADVAQRAILAPVPAVSGPFAFASAYVSASREAAIGGDLLDVVPTETGAIRIIVGDVRGKGLGAVRLSAMMLASFREMALTLSGLDQLPRLLDKRLAPQLGPEDFVTAVLAELRPNGELMLINCAHPPPLLMRNGLPSLLRPAEPTTPFGLGPDPHAVVVHLEPGDRVLFYTDGLIEARPAGAREFLPLDTLAEPAASGSFDGAVEKVLARLRDSVGGQLHDDLALLLTEFRGASDAEGEGPAPARALNIERMELGVVDGRAVS